MDKYQHGVLVIMVITDLEKSFDITVLVSVEHQVTAASSVGRVCLLCSGSDFLVLLHNKIFGSSLI